MKKKLAVVMIVKNEEELLSRCLDSIKGVDEIVVCDTGSEDNTVEIAKQYTDKVFTDYTWNDSFCEARNHSKSKVSKDIDWILTIDADEYLVNPIEDVYKEIEKATTDTLRVRLEAEANKEVHVFPRLYRNIPEIYWVNNVHNLLNKDDRSETELKIVYGYSPAHKKDPDREMRILLKTIADNPDSVRERYYLGKAFFKKGLWQKSVDMLDEYLKRSKFLMEKEDAYLQRARALAKLGNFDEACNSALMALKYNANFKEALFFLADHMDWQNADRWLSFAELADNRNILFNRTSTTEKGEEYYNELFNKDTNMSRYTDILKKIGELVEDKKVLDIGCGLAEASKYIDNYSGFDFSNNAIEKVKAKYPELDVWVGDAYEEKNYKDADIYMSTEVLEHVDDLEIIKNIPKGKRFIFSVPSFRDPSHLRIYTEDLIKLRLPIDIQNIYRFNWVSNRWKLNGNPNAGHISLYILLVDSFIKK